VGAAAVVMWAAGLLLFLAVLVIFFFLFSCSWVCARELTPRWWRVWRGDATLDGGGEWVALCVTSCDSGLEKAA